MAHRLSKIYTRTGDDGATGLGDGSRVSKDSLRVACMGDVDELNAIIGVLITELENLNTFTDTSIISLLTKIQHDLFNLGGEICIPKHIILTQSDVGALENSIDSINHSLPSLKEFILPGGTKAAAYCHLARTVCRRAERTLIKLNKIEAVTAISLQYLNRLSDLLFVTCRAINQQAGVSDVLWNHHAN